MFEIEVDPFIEIIAYYPKVRKITSEYLIKIGSSKSEQLFCKI